MANRSAKKVVSALLGEAVLGQCYKIVCRVRNLRTGRRESFRLSALLTANIEVPGELSEPYRMTLFSSRLKPLNHWELSERELPPWSDDKWGELCTAAIPEDCDFESVSVEASEPV